MSQCLETERLLLRTPDPRDAATLAVIAADYDVSRMTTRIPHPYRRADAEHFIAKAAEDRASIRGYAFVIGRKPDGYCLGVAGLHREKDAFELGYMIGRYYWGQGYATEAARALVMFAFVVLSIDRIIAGYFCDNPASGRVLAKLGFLAIGTEEKHSSARRCKVLCHQLELTRDQFASRMV